MYFDSPRDDWDASSARTSGKSIGGFRERERQRERRRRGEGKSGRKRNSRALARERPRVGLILNPSDWRVLDETRRVLATPDGTDALSDVKLKHAALTRRFDDTPYNLTLPPVTRGTTSSLSVFLRLSPSPFFANPVAITTTASNTDSGSVPLGAVFRTMRRIAPLSFLYVLHN